MTVLLLGTDANAARLARAPLTDCIIVVSFSADRRRLLMISIPRDTVDVPMPDGEIWSDKINSMYARRGIETIADSVETLLALPIDHHVLLNMDDFARVVDAVGGITVDVETSLSDPRVGFSLQSGPHHLDGLTALRYARHRVQGGDYARAERQQRLLLALAEAITAEGAQASVGQLFTVLRSLRTDFRLTDLPAMVELARQVGGAEVTGIVLKPPRFALFEGIAGARGWIMIPNVGEMRAFVDASLDD